MWLLGVIRAALLAAGLAALTAIGAGWLMTRVDTGTGSDWIGSLQAFALQIAIVCLIAALGSSALMPPRAAVVAPAPRERSSAVSLGLSVLLAGLAVLALLQIPSIAAWWSNDRMLLDEATGTGRDPMGLRIIPQVMLLSLPTLAALTVAAGVLTSAIGILVRAALVLRVLAACVLLQAGLVVGEHLILRALGSLGGTVRTLVDQSADPKAVAQVSDFLARHDAPAAAVSGRLLYILAGYAIAVGIAALVSAAQHAPPRALPRMGCAGSEFHERQPARLQR